MGETIKSGQTPAGHASATGVDQLFANLANEHENTRREARYALVAMGEPVVPALIAIVSGHQKHLARWEAAKALSQIGSPTAVPALIVALDDQEFDIRWLASEGLVAAGTAALPPLLHALCERPQSIWLREGAHHVLKSQSDPRISQKVAPVLAALQGHEADLTVGPAAQAALAAW
jgi:HEAT repeat protein